MTIAEPIQHIPPVPGDVTFDQVVEAFEDKLESDVSKIIRCFAVVNGSLQLSRKHYYLPQEITHEDVVEVIGGLLRRGELSHYLLSMLSGLLLDRTRGEQRLLFQDWTAFSEQPCIAVIIMLN